MNKNKYLDKKNLLLNTIDLTSVKRKNRYIRLHLLFLLVVQRRTVTSQLVSGGCQGHYVKLNRLLQSKHPKSCTKSRCPQWPRVYRLDNGSYSTIQPPTYPTYIMKIEEWPALFGILLFFDAKIDPDYTTKFSPNL